VAKLLKVAGFGVWYNRSHTIHILACTDLHETGGILARLMRHIVTVLAKMMTEIFHKGHKTISELSQWSLGGRI
jgi:hypothetical protein